jgi:hypothetical protein
MKFQNCGSPFSTRANTAQAKNGDKQFWKEGFHVANGKAHKFKFEYIFNNVLKHIV